MTDTEPAPVPHDAPANGTRPPTAMPPADLLEAYDRAAGYSMEALAGMMAHPGTARVLALRTEILARLVRHDLLLDGLGEALDYIPPGAIPDEARDRLRALIRTAPSE